MEVKRVGVVGGGQLAAMMQPPGVKLGLELIIQTPHSEDPAAIKTKQLVLGKIDDAKATAKLATLCDVITFENEFINLPELQTLANQGVCFRPGLSSLAPLLDKYEQRCFFQEIGLPVPQFTTLDTLDQLDSFREFPLVLKARRHGYDGQGTFIIKSKREFKAIWEKLNYPPMLIEEYVPFTHELAVIAGRNSKGEIAVYPVVETQQEDQVCRRVYAPAAISLSITQDIEAIARTLLEKLQFIGVLGIEFFLTKENQILINEIAPRTHNSGHYTLDACATSQFEMQLRAIADLPLGDPSLQCEGAVMVNLLGYEHCYSDYAEKRHQLSILPNTYVHWYGKTESRPGRKLGHVTTLLTQQQELSLLPSLAQKIESIWRGS